MVTEVRTTRSCCRIVISALHRLIPVPEKAVEFEASTTDWIIVDDHFASIGSHQDSTRVMATSASNIRLFILTRELAIRCAFEDVYGWGSLRVIVFRIRRRVAFQSSGLCDQLPAAP